MFAFSADMTGSTNYNQSAGRPRYATSDSLDTFMLAPRSMSPSVISGSRIACFVILGLSVSGCGGSSEPVVPVGSESTVTAPADGASASPGTNANANTAAGSSTSEGIATAPSRNTKHRRDEVWVDEKGQKWFGNVPMDAFFDNPYEVASNQTPIGGGTVQVASADDNAGDEKPVVAPAGKEPEMADGTPPAEPASSETPAGAAAGSDSWAGLISMATIDEEVKSIRNFMTENVQSVGTFNSSMLMIPPKAAALGALSEVVKDHSETVSWKDDAKYIRDLSKKINSAPLQRGAKDQKRVQELFEAISDTLNRSRPAGLEEPPETDSFAEVAEMRLLMMRMEEAEKKMKTEAGTESAMGSKKELILHESSMMAVMAKIVSTPGYGYGDDAKFTGYAGDVVNASLAIKAAAEANDFAAYESALTKIATTCSNCHSDYKND